MRPTSAVGIEFCAHNPCSYQIRLKYDHSLCWKCLLCSLQVWDFHFKPQVDNIASIYIDPQQGHEGAWNMHGTSSYFQDCVPWFLEANSLEWVIPLSSGIGDNSSSTCTEPPSSATPGYQGFSVASLVSMKTHL